MNTKEIIQKFRTNEIDAQTALNLIGEVMAARSEPQGDIDRAINTVIGLASEPEANEDRKMGRAWEKSRGRK